MTKQWWVVTGLALAAMAAAPGDAGAAWIGVRVGPARVIHAHSPVVAYRPALRVWVADRVALPAGLGRLEIEVEPDRARVYLDGQSLGRGDTARALRAGRHQLRVVGPGGSATQFVEVRPGRVTRVEIKLG